MKYTIAALAATTLAANAATVMSLYDAGGGATADDPRNQGWTFREVTADGTDGDDNGLIDPTNNQGPVMTSTDVNAWQLNDQNENGGTDLPQFAYQFDAATTTAMNDNGFTLTVAIENLGTRGGVWFGVRDPQENAGPSGMFGRTASSRTAFTSGAPVDGTVSVLTLTWDPDAGTMTRALNGSGTATTWSNNSDNNYLGSILGGSQLLVDSGSSSNTGAVWNLVSAELSIVPEPSSAALLGLGGLALILRRRK